MECDGIEVDPSLVFFCCLITIVATRIILFQTVIKTVCHAPFVVVEGIQIIVSGSEKMMQYGSRPLHHKSHPPAPLPAPKIGLEGVNIASNFIVKFLYL